ncbi:MAG TPA: hypothetical protein VK168_18575 [Saprospiraceae bacterium]|nr:hypothetical protein [Saprospiraceae bacterium]
MAKTTLTFLFSLGIVCRCFAQTPIDTTANVDTNRVFYKYDIDQKQYISILTGYHYRKSHFAELGIAVNRYGRKGRHPIGWAYFVSSEIKIDKQPIIGPKVGAWMAGGQSIMALDINLIYYTDFEQSSLRLRPEIGIGFGRFKVFYGYNIPLSNRHFEGINRNVFGLALLFGVKQTKHIQRDE